MLNPYRLSTEEKNVEQEKAVNFCPENVPGQLKTST